MVADNQELTQKGTLSVKGTGTVDEFEHFGQVEKLLMGRSRTLCFELYHKTTPARTQSKGHITCGRKVVGE